MRNHHKCSGLDTKDEDRPHCPWPLACPSNLTSKFEVLIGAKPPTRELNGKKCLCVSVSVCARAHVRSGTVLIHYA